MAVGSRDSRDTQVHIWPESTPVFKYYKDVTSLSLPEIHLLLSYQGQSRKNSYLQSFGLRNVNKRYRFNLRKSERRVEKKGPGESRWKEGSEKVGERDGDGERGRKSGRDRETETDREAETERKTETDRKKWERRLNKIKFYLGPKREYIQFN